MLAWIYLAAAIATEVIGTVFLRFTDGFTRPLLSALVVVTVGTAAVAVIGMAAIGESVSALKLASVVLVIGGVVGLNLSGAH